MLVLSPCVLQVREALPWLNSRLEPSEFRRYATSAGVQGAGQRGSMQCMLSDSCCLPLPLPLPLPLHSKYDF
jgi:hypothetical protein